MIKVYYIYLKKSIFFDICHLKNMGLGIFEAIFIEAFVSIHMSAFVLWPISTMFDQDREKKLFIKLFSIRAIVLLFFDFFVTFIVVPLLGISRTKIVVKNKGQKIDEHKVNYNFNYQNNTPKYFERNWNNNCQRLNKYINLDKSVLEELVDFVNRDSKNTITVTPNLIILRSPNEPSKSIGVISKNADFERIIVTKDSFDLHKIEGAIEYK